LLKEHPEFKGRLKFWTNKLCAEKPQTFDIVLAVRLPYFPSLTHSLTKHSSEETAQSSTPAGSSSTSSHPYSPSPSAPSAFLPNSTTQATPRH
jgi:hypothetical protein